MSTRSKLLAMTEDLHFAPDKQAAERAEDSSPPAQPPAQPAQEGGQKFPPVSRGAVARTGPGQMLQFRGQVLAAEGEVGRLKERLKEYDGSEPTRKLDPKLIDPSRWANRHADSFGTPEFARLQQDIELAGGNVQPISVRTSTDQAGRYEIVFGHRRHRACLELGLPVLATVTGAAASDLELFAAMDRENRERADLSAYEQGTMYRRALDAGLYPSNRRLAEALGVSHTWVANVLQVADLPSPVIECFRSPLDIQPRHVRSLAAGLEVDRKAILRRAEKLRIQGHKLPPAALVAALLGEMESQKGGRPTALNVGGKRVGSWSRDSAGRFTLELEAGIVSDEGLQGLLKAVEDAIRR